MNRKSISKGIKTLLLSFMIIIILKNVTFAEIFGWPLAGDSPQVSSPMYDRTGIATAGYHNGWDFSGSNDHKVMASASGIVTNITKVGSSCGNSVTIKHNLKEDFVYDNKNYGNVIYTRYLHLKSTPKVKKGDKVKKGQVIGEMGGTGTSSNSYDVHLHFDCMSKATGGNAVAKALSETAGSGTGKHNPWKGHQVYTVMYTKTNPKKAHFSPEIIIGQDLSKDSAGQGSTDNQTNGDEDDNVSGGIMDKLDNDIELMISGDLIQYGKLDNLEQTTKKLKDTIKEYSKILIGIFIFISVICIGFGIILKRNKAEDRMMLISGLMAVGVGALIITSAIYVVDFVAQVMN